MSCKPPSPSRGALLRRLSELQAEQAQIVATLAAEELDDEAPAVAPPPLPKVKQRRGPRIPRGLVPLTAEEREQLARAGGILGQ